MIVEIDTHQFFPNIKNKVKVFILTILSNIVRNLLPSAIWQGKMHGIKIGREKNTLIFMHR